MIFNIFYETNDTIATKNAYDIDAKFNVQKIHQIRSINVNAQ